MAKKFIASMWCDTPQEHNGVNVSGVASATSEEAVTSLWEEIAKHSSLEPSAGKPTIQEVEV